MTDQGEITIWKLETAKLYCEQINQSCEVKEAIDFAEACYENINGDILEESPQDCVYAEIDAMRSNL